MTSQPTSAAFALFSDSTDFSSGLAFSPPPLLHEVLRSEVSASVKYTVESLDLGGDLTLLKGRVSTQEVLSLSNSDLVPGKYEGGLKLWEGSIDLVKALQSEIHSGSLCFPGKRVLELGCGHGLPAIFACLQGATTVHFQDFNAEVLRCLTIPNVNANMVSSLHFGGEIADKDIRFFAGDWSNVGQLLPFVKDSEKDHNLEISMGYDIILMAETVYSISSLPSLYELIKKCLCRPTGVVYMAAKKHYFGVGGGSRRFLSVMDKDGVMTGCIISEVTDGSSNVREVWKLSFKQNESPYVKVRSSTHYIRSKPSVHRTRDQADTTEWNQVFALRHHRNESVATNTLEICAWDSQSEKFLGGVCFDVSEVPVREPPDGPLAPQWYRLEGGAPDDKNNRISGDILLSVWIGTQADDAFPEAWNSDAPSHVAHTCSKVYQSPKLWYLRVTVIEAQDLQISPNLLPLTAPEIRVKGQLGFQSVRTRRGSVSGHATTFHWNEGLIFVAGEPLEESLVIVVEDITVKETVLLGHILIPMSSIEQRIDERHVAAKWFALEGGMGGGAISAGGGRGENGITYCGRVHMRLCLEGGYHVLDEAAHVCSDFRPTAKQLKPAVGMLELGILRARGLLPMKSKGPGKAQGFIQILAILIIWVGQLKINAS